MMKNLISLFIFYALYKGLEYTVRKIYRFIKRIILRLVAKYGSK